MANSTGRIINILFCLLSICLLIGSCVESNQESTAYLQDLKQWRVDRVKDLTANDGWTTLAGLFWLEEGNNSFGSGEENDLISPGRMPEICGNFIVDGDKVYFEGDSHIRVDNHIVNEDQYLVYADNINPPPVLSWDSYQWFVIKRGPRLGIRLRDSLHVSRFALTEIPHYPDDVDWNLEATISLQDTNQTLTIDNMVGITSKINVVATLTFQIGQQVYELYAIPGGTDQYFVIFADETTGNGTYHGGRYLYVNIPPEGNVTYLDFNRAINPPCVFTEFATCPLPPPDNVLEIAVDAGERYVKFSSE